MTTDLKFELFLNTRSPIAVTSCPSNSDGMTSAETLPVNPVMTAFLSSSNVYV